MFVSGASKCGILCITHTMGERKPSSSELICSTESRNLHPCRRFFGAIHVMHIGTLTIWLYLHDTESLKDKRQILKSLIETTRQKFNISMAEVDEMDKWQVAVVGVACVANDNRFVNQVLDKVINHLEANPRIEVGEVEMELL